MPSSRLFFVFRAFLVFVFLCVPALTAGCEEDPAPTGWEDIQTPDFSGPQPGLDDPGARPWQHAGSFYPEDPADLYRNVVGLMRDTGVRERRDAAAVITPHASLRYSGEVQAEVFARITVPEVVVVLASDHELEGQPFAVWGQGPWLIPGYRVRECCYSPRRTWCTASCSRWPGNRTRRSPTSYVVDFATEPLAFVPRDEALAVERSVLRATDPNCQPGNGTHQMV